MMQMCLTSAFSRDYSLSAGGVPSVGFDSPVKRRTTAAKRFFYVRHIMATFYERAVWEGANSAGSFSRSVNPHSSAHPYDSGEAENLNRLKRSLTMKRTSNGTTAPITTPILKLASQLPTHKAALVPNKVEQECVNYLRTILLEAESGELIGFAIAVMYKKGNYIVNSTGEVHRSPTFALGMLAMLKDHFVKLVYGRSE